MLQYATIAYDSTIPSCHHLYIPPPYYHFIAMHYVYHHLQPSSYTPYCVPSSFLYILQPSNMQLLCMPTILPTTWHHRVHLHNRPYYPEWTASRPLCKVKQDQARVVLRWVTTGEVLVLIIFFFSSHPHRSWSIRTQYITTRWWHMSRVQCKGDALVTAAGAYCGQTDFAFGDHKMVLEFF